jgi:hypothetical protein
MVAPAFRSPWARPGTSASTHRSRNQFSNPASVNDRLRSLTRKVILPQGEASMTRWSAGRVGNVSRLGFWLRPLYWVNVSFPSRACRRPKRVMSDRRCPVNNRSARASRAFANYRFFWKARRSFIRARANAGNHPSANGGRPPTAIRDSSPTAPWGRQIGQPVHAKPSVRASQLNEPVSNDGKKRLPQMSHPRLGKDLQRRPQMSTEISSLHAPPFLAAPPAKPAVDREIID